MAQILISADEENDKVIALLDKWEIPYEIATISFKIGDYLINGYLDEEGNPHGSMLVERVTVGDWWGKLKSGRSNNQLVDLSDNVRLSVLAVIGHIELNLPAQVQVDYVVATSSLVAGFVSSCWKKCNQGAEGNVAVINCLSEEFFVLFLKELLKWCDIQDPRIPKIERLSRNPDWQYLFFLQTIPGVGDNLSKILAFKFPTPYDLVTASVEEIQDTEGIGKKKSQTIYDFFREQRGLVF